MEDFEFFPPDEEEEDIQSEEGSNRTFIVLVAAMGGLLAVAVCVLVGWAVIYPRISASLNAENQATFATGTAAAEIPKEEATSTPTEVARPATETPPPTWTPQPAATTRPTATPEPTATPAEIAADAAEGPTPTRRPTATPRPDADSGSEVPSTGIGVFAAGALALGFLLVLVIVRRTRRTA